MRWLTSHLLRHFHCARVTSARGILPSPSSLHYIRPLPLPFPIHGRPQLARSENVPQKSHSFFSAAGGMGGQRRRQILRSGASKASSLPFSCLTSQGAGAEKINILRKKRWGAGKRMLAVGAKGRWGGLAHKDSLEEEREDGVIDLIRQRRRFSEEI